MDGKRLGIDQRLFVDRKVGFALALLALMFVATLLDFGAELWRVGSNNLLAFQAPLLLRRTTFTVVLVHVGWLSAPVGTGLAALVLLAWIGVGVWMWRRDVRAFATGVIALLVDASFLWLSMRAGRELPISGVFWFAMLRVPVLSSWIGVWRTLSTLRHQGYGLLRARDPGASAASAHDSP